jgi:hypothetical protein
MEEREMSSGLFLIEPLGAQQSVMGGTAAIIKIARIDNIKHGYFGWV